MCWGPEGLYYVDEGDRLGLVKEFKYGTKTYELRSLANVYSRVVSENAMLVCCDKAMCVVYRPMENTLAIDVVNGNRVEFPISPDIVRRAVHFGCFYWQRMLTVYYLLRNSSGESLEYAETNFELI